MDRRKGNQDNTGIAGKLSKTLLRERKRLPRYFLKCPSKNTLLPYNTTMSLANELLLRTTWDKEELEAAFIVVHMFHDDFEDNNNGERKLSSTTTPVANSNDDVQHILLLTTKNILMIEVFSSKDAKPEVMWCVNMSNVKEIRLNNNTLTILKKSKVIKTTLEKLAKNNVIWKLRKIIVDDHHLSWSDINNKLLGKMVFQPKNCRCINGRKISVSGKITTNKKAGKIQKYTFRASTIAAAAEFCGAMKKLELNIIGVNDERLQHFIKRANDIATLLYLDDDKHYHDNKYHNINNTFKNKLSLNENDDDSDDSDDSDNEEDENRKNDDADSLNDSRIRSDSLDSLASIASIEAELNF
jgi:hypothetical protein